MRLSCVDRKNGERPQHCRDASCQINWFSKTSRHLIDFARFKGSEDDQIGTWLKRGTQLIAAAGWPPLVQSFRWRPPGPKFRSLRIASQVLRNIMWKNDRPIFDGHPAITHAQSKVIGFRSGEENPTEVTPMDEKWRVSHVELLEGGLLFGLVLCDEKGRPCVSFGYSGRAKADLSRNHVAAALKDAEQVLGR